MVESRSSISLFCELWVLMRPSCGKRFFGDIHSAENLNAAQHRIHDAGWQLIDIMQNAVYSETHIALISTRLNMNIAGSLIEGILQ